MRYLRFLFVVLSIGGMASIVSAQLVDDDFDSLAVGADMHSRDGWEGWYGDGNVGGLVTDEQAYSGQHSLRFTRPVDLVPYWASPTSGDWILVTMQYVPSAASSGDAYYGVLHSYEAGTAGTAGWITEVISDFATNDVRISGGETARVPLVRDAWAEIRVELDFAAQVSTFYYNGELLGTREATSLSGLDLWANSNDVIYFDDFWLGTVQMYDTQASNLGPEDGASDVLREAVLSWEPGSYAEKHDVYFGTVLDDVSHADRANPLDVLVSQGQSQTRYEPDSRLEFGQTYYWRIDEVNGVSDNTVFKGVVWSFTSEAYSIPVETITATASGANADMGPEKTIDGSGLDELDQHSTEPTDMWLTETDGSWIQYEFDKAYKLHEMLIWNSNQAVEPFIGFGLNEVILETSVDGENWFVAEGVTELARAAGATNNEANNAVALDNVMAKFVKLSVVSAYGFTGQSGLAEVRFLAIPVSARAPQPADGVTTATATVELSWRSGREAVSHDVYLGTDAENLVLIDTTDTTSTVTDSLDYKTTYFWSVTEMNDAADPTTHTGDVWTFSTPEYETVDNFESYSAELDEEVYLTWFDGYGGDDSLGGSTTGHIDAPFVETARVSAGNQSLPIYIDNDGGFVNIDGNVSSPTFSEVARDIEGQDWTLSELKTLSIMLSGSAGLTGQLYCKIDGTKILYDGDAANLSLDTWQAWNIDLSTVGGNLTNVRELAIGVDGGTSGILYIDAIRLYPNF